MRIPCEANPEVWFSESTADVDQAKGACGFCPVRAECAELGENEEFGIWGGQTPEDRIATKRLRLIILEETINSRIRIMQAEGESISAMARELGMPRKTLADRLRRLARLAA
ncbi:WhiB family transcriptional regulator [Streptomyces sp. NPDC097617]|uniref:WhiB family transcriptional regulator n=1 Tax=Streptomyces sp. NPDC097617 TaxID=3366091 RepID=UPI00380E8E14